MFNFGISEAVFDFVKNAEADAKKQFEAIDKIGEYNTYKVLSAFAEVGVSERHFIPTTGYGYSDGGREKLGRQDLG